MDAQRLLARMQAGENVNLDRWGQARTFAIGAYLDGGEIVVGWSDANQEENGEERYPNTPEGAEELLDHWG